MQLVEVRPIEKERWHGLKGKDVITRPVVIEALLSSTTGKLATGLTPEDRERLEKETGYDLSPDYKAGKPHPFWSSPAAFVKLEHKTNIFDISNPLDEIRVKIMKASDLVANSQKEYDEGKFDNYIIINPKIVSNSMEKIYVELGEGCLSVNREVDGIVPRYARVTIEGYDMDGNKIRVRGREELAIAFQHELDHLNGILFVDRL